MLKINELVAAQRAYFLSGKTREYSFRLEQLKKLQNILKSNEDKILNALKEDLNKSNFEAYATEIALVYHELDYMIKNLHKLSKPKRVKSSIYNFPSKSYLYKDPYGCVLIMSPWNYPYQLAIIPLIGSMAAGNCTIVKPSNYSKNTSALLTKLLSEFNPEYISVVEGGRGANTTLLDEKFDLIFFTGSTTVGKLVMEKASKHLTPVILELGGKSPCIVDKSANLDLAAKRFVWAKLVNAGQTCVAPDYLLVHKEIKNQFIEKIKLYVEKMYGKAPESNQEYAKIINEQHFQRLLNIINNTKASATPNIDGEVICGGAFNTSTLQIAPTIIDNCSFDAIAMEEELFGPIMPIIEYENIDEIIETINSRPTPLALYIFTTNKAIEEKILTKTSFGGGCVNDCINHLVNSNLPFGGVGESGMGRYHGKETFYAFSHQKSIEKRGGSMEINLRYPPYEGHFKILKKIMK